MAAPQRLAVAALGQPLERVLANRLQHPEAWLAAGHALGAEQVVAQERFHTVDDVELEVPGDGVGSSQREAADEDAEAREEHLLLLGQEVEAPLDRGAQRPVPLGHACAGLGPQELEPLTQAHEDVARREQLDSCGGQLEGERQPVQVHAELTDSLGVQLRELEVDSRVAGTIDEQPYRVRSPKTVDLEPVGRVGKLERSDGVDPLVGDAQRGAASDQERHPWRNQQLREQWRRFQHVLEVVEHEQCPSTAQVGGQ